MEAGYLTDPQTLVTNLLQPRRLSVRVIDCLVGAPNLQFLSRQIGA